MKQVLVSLVGTLAAGLMIVACSSAPKVKSPAANPEDQRLTAVITAYSEAAKRLDPYDAPYFNVEEDLGKFGDALSPEMRERSKKLVETSLASLSTIVASKLSNAQNVAYTLFKGDLERSLREFDFRLDYFSFNQMGNRLRSYIDDSSPELTSFPLDSAVHYRAFLQRSEGFPAFVDRQITNLKEGAKAGYALNCTIAKAAAETYKDALEPTIEKNPFYRPALKMPASIGKKDQEELTAGFRTMVQDRILPAFKKFDEYYRGEYLKKCRKTYGLMGVPQGKEIYQNSIRGSTDLDLSAKTIHETGLKEVARIRAEMLAALREIGYKGDLRSSLVKLTKDEKSYFTDVDSMFAVYQAYRDKVSAAMPSVFALQPKTEFKIVAGENPEDAAGRYGVPTDFMPIGRFIVNAKNLKGTPRFGTHTLFLHEAIPGHHFQLALQYEMKDQLSEYQRKIFYSVAFGEGWALYAERLGREIGLVSDPYQLVGSLADEMLRAVRLVVDTGIHAYGWPREKVLKYMTDNLPTEARGIQIEADLYSVWPGQALGYKIGQLKILELRERAKKELGAKFDIKEFHRVVIGGGTLSLPVLESKVLAWIASVKASAT
jgi:uncharacterized protein (DUF885 family)